MADKREDTFDGLAKTKQVASWRCDTCKEVGENDTNFVFVYGNVCRGSSMGLIGNNFGDDGHLVKVSVFCRQCFDKIIFGAFVEAP